MMNDKIYRIRRAIVMALYAYTGPQDIDTVMLHPNLAVEAATADMVRAEWDNLIASGALVAVPGYQGSVAKLAAGLRCQMQQTGGNTPLTATFWGHEVL